jgi:MFS family permease
LLIAVSNQFWGFWFAMVVMTLGELVVVPRASAIVANLAPVDKRGRYMSLFGLTWNVASGISPVFGGVLSDQLSPRAPWLVGVLIGMLACISFWTLYRRQKGREFGKLSV